MRCSFEKEYSVRGNILWLVNVKFVARDPLLEIM